MAYIGDFRLGDTLDTKFCTVTTTGAPTVLAGTPVISAYVGNSLTQITAGITLTVDFDAVVGLNNVRVVASGVNGFATASNYQLVITTGTVGGTSVVGYVVAEFSIENRSAVMPTTAARTLDVSATGEAGVDWANVGSPTTTVGLTGTTVDLVANAVDAAAVAVGAITADAFAAGAIDAAAIANGAIDAATFAAGAIDAAAIAADAIGSSELAASAVTEIQAGLSTLTAAQVNTEVVDALSVDTYTEPGIGTPAATATLATKIGFLYKAWRNRTTQTSTTYSLMNDDTTTVDQKATVADDGTTFSITEKITGP